MEEIVDNYVCVSSTVVPCLEPSRSGAIEILAGVEVSEYVKVLTKLLRVLFLYYSRILDLLLYSGKERLSGQRLI